MPMEATLDARVEGRKEPTIAGAIDCASRLVDRLHSVDQAFGATLDRMRGPLPPQGSDDRGDYEKAGLLEDLDRALAEAGAVVSLLSSKTDEIERLAGEHVQ